MPKLSGGPPRGTAIFEGVYQQRRGVTGKAVRLADPPQLLAGREDLLADLDTRLTGGDGSGPRTVALCGLGGAGKTSVALAYAHRHLGEVGVAWQFAAEDPTVLAAAFGELAAQLGARGEGGMRDPVASVHGTLAAFPAGWLLTFDNARDRASVERFVPPAGRGLVLITSQNQNWLPGQALEVPVLDPAAGAGFLVTRASDEDQQAALALADELGGLPLALELAGAYIQATGTTLAGYLPVFQGRRADLLARGQAGGHPADVAATVGLALSRLAEDAPAAAGLLRLLAALAPEPVPLALLLSDTQAVGELAPDVAATVGPLLGDRAAVGGAVATLRRYSLITPAGDGLVLVHRLVQATTLAQVPAEVAGQWRQAAAALVEAAIPADTELPVAWPVCAGLLPHARAVLDPTSDGLWRIANYLGHSGHYLAARDQFQLITDAFTEHDGYGPEHRHTLAARGNLATWTAMTGDAAGARDQYAALLPMAKRAWGRRHPDTLAARANLARWTGEAGDAAGARHQYIALLPLQERALGPEHPDTLATRANLAAFSGPGGNAARARDQYAALLPVCERVLGPEHLDTLAARASLARWTGEAGDAAGARDQYTSLMPLLERALGPEHPNTLAARASLASFTGQAGDAAGARDQYAALLPVCEVALGPEHPDTLTTRGNLARWTGEAGDAAGACDQYLAVLPIRERVLGPEHPGTLAARASLARWTGEVGDAAGARDEYAALLPLLKGALGPEHPDTLATRASLASFTGQAGDAAGARDQYAALLPVLERALGPEHPGTLAARRNLAHWTGEADRGGN